MAIKKCPSCGGENHEDVTVCLHCNTDILDAPSGNAASSSAPPPIIPSEKQIVVKPQNNQMAFAAVFLGIISIIFSVFTGLPGLIMGIISMVQIIISHGRQKGMGWAVTGIILSVLLSAYTSILDQIISTALSPAFP